MIVTDSASFCLGKHKKGSPDTAALLYSLNYFVARNAFSCSVNASTTFCPPFSIIGKAMCFPGKHLQFCLLIFLRRCFTIGKRHHLIPLRSLWTHQIQLTGWLSIYPAMYTYENNSTRPRSISIKLQWKIPFSS